MSGLKCAATILLAAALPLAACAGDDDANGYATAAREAAAQAVLSLDNFPAGWQQAGSDSGRPSLELRGECGIFNEANASRFEGEVATSDSPRFTASEDRDVRSSVSIFETETAATEAIRRAKVLIEGCSREVEDAATRLINGRLPGNGAGDLVSDIDVRFGKFSFSPYGDSSDAYRLDAAVSSLLFEVQYTADVIVVRAGPVIGVFTYLVSGDVDQPEEETLVRALAGNLDTARTALPEAN